MSEMPTPRQALILWCLLGRHGSAMQSALVPRVEKVDRDALVAGRYVESAKQGRSLRLTVTDRGWAWAGANLRAPLPPAFRALQDWLERVDADLAATGRTLAELVGPAPTEPTPTAPTPRARRQPAAAPRKNAGAEPLRPSPKKNPNPIRARIEAAYLALTGGERARAVRLSALRAHLGDLDRASVDAGLAAILRRA